jgi:hypothetical protein
VKTEIYFTPSFPRKRESRASINPGFPVKLGMTKRDKRDDGRSGFPVKLGMTERDIGMTERDMGMTERDKRDDGRSGFRIKCGMTKRMDSQSSWECTRGDTYDDKGGYIRE